MSEFEFIAVFVSIIFGLSLTQVLSGAVTLAQNRTLDSNRLGWSLFVLYVLALNWWTFFPWAENEEWTFGEFFMVLVWALAHYVMAAALYPDRSLEEDAVNERRTLVLWAFLLAAVTDIGQTALRGSIFDPWFYLVFVLYLMGATSLGLLTANDTVHRIIPWFLVLSMVIWSVLVRWLLD